MAAPKFARRRDRIVARALGPPVEEPIATRGGSRLEGVENEVNFEVWDFGVED